jgi:HNH endonuclease
VIYVFDLTGARAHGGRHSRFRSRPRGSIRQRFNRLVIRPDDPAACWGWTAALFPSGYVAICDTPPSRRMLLGHRVSFQLHVGPIPPDRCVMHECDVRSCTNPAHLRLGTIRDNNDDKVMKGRQPRGEGHPRAKLTQQQVDLIRSLRSSCQASIREIATWFGVSRSLVCLILRGKCWVSV